MSDTPTEFIDFEFAFTNGQLLTVTAQLGRDTIDGTPDHVRLYLHPAPGVHEEVLVTRSALSYMRTTQRTVAPERQTDGFIQVTEGHISAGRSASAIVQLPQDGDMFERDAAVFDKLTHGTTVTPTPLNLPTILDPWVPPLDQEPL